MGARPRSTGNGRVDELTTCLPYVRVSTDEQATEGLSLPAQIEAVRRYAAGRGWVLGTEYKDVMSGRRDDRPQYQAMLAEVERLRAEGRSVAVAVVRVDRLGRDLVEGATTYKKLKAAGIGVHTIREGGELPEVMVNMLLTWAQEESRRIGERVRDVQQSVMEKGWWRVGKVPWGYALRDATPEERAEGAPKRVLALDPVAWPYVREARERAAGGESVRSIARWVASLPSEVRGGRHFGHKAVQFMLVNPLYAGRFPNGQPGRWPAIVGGELHARILAAQPGHSGRRPSGRYLLTGLLRCARCGGPMGGKWEVLRGYGHYRCNGGHHLGAGAPNLRCIRHVHAGKVDALVLAEVGAVLAALPADDADLRRAWAELQQPDPGDALRRQRRRAIDEQSRRAREHLRAAALKLVEGDLDRKGYDLARAKYERDLEGAEAERARLEAEAPTADRRALPPVETVLAELGGWRAALAAYTLDVPAARAALAELIERVLAAPVTRGARRYHAEIVWTAKGDGLRRLAAGHVPSRTEAAAD